MKQVCLVCERASADRNLYCQDVRCPAELSPPIFDYGELLGDIEIVKLVIIQRTATLYEARRAGSRIYLKVAHPGLYHTKRLKREALLLSELQQQHALGEQLPSLLPPYVEASINTVPYGKIVRGSHLLYYSVFEYIPGEPLRDVLKKTPQLWINHVGRIALGLAMALTVLQSKGRLHLGVSPDAALVHFNERTNLPRVLLVDLGLACSPQNFDECRYDGFVALAYMAPELLVPASASPDYSSDVYGLGLTLYEMLVGETPITARLRGDDEIAEMVRRGRMVRMSREDDVQPIARIAMAAVASSRPKDAYAFAQELIAYFKQMPAQPRRSRFNLEMVLAIVVALLVVAFVIALAITIGSLTGVGEIIQALPEWSGLYDV